MKKTGIVVCMLAALVGLAGCSSVVTGDKADGANEKNPAQRVRDSSK